MAEEPFKISPLMIQYLAGLSNDLSAYGANTDKGFQPTGINKVTNENIKAQGLMKLLKQTLGPDGSSMSIGKDGIKVNATQDSDLFRLIMGEEKAEQAAGQGQASEAAPTQTAAAAPTQPQTQPQPQTRAGAPNPFTPSAPNLNMNLSNFAGLTPENIMAVIGAKQNQDQLKMQSYRDIVDSVYKKALGDKAVQEVEYGKKLYKTDDGMELDAKDYIAYQKLIKEDQTPAIKNYQYAQKQGFTGSFVEFQDMAKTGHKKDYDEAVKGGYKGAFNTWMLDMAKAGAINIGDLLTKESELTKLEGEKYFASPNWTKDLQSHIGSKDVQNRIADVRIPDLGTKASKEDKQKAYRDATALERSKITIEFIEGKIAAGGGKVIADPVMAKDGKTVTWKVQWPSGSITNVTQAVR